MDIAASQAMPPREKPDVVVAVSLKRRDEKKKEERRTINKCMACDQGRSCEPDQGRTV